MKKEDGTRDHDEPAWRREKGRDCQTTLGSSPGHPIHPASSDPGTIRSISPSSPPLLLSICVCESVWELSVCVRITARSPGGTIDRGAKAIIPRVLRSWTFMYIPTGLYRYSFPQLNLSTVIRDGIDFFFVPFCFSLPPSWQVQRESSLCSR